MKVIIGSKVVLPVILDVKINVWADGAVRGHQSKQNAIVMAMMKWLARNEERQDLQASECCTVFFPRGLVHKVVLPALLGHGKAQSLMFFLKQS